MPILTPELQRQQAFCQAIMQAFDSAGSTPAEAVGILASILISIFVRLRQQPALDAAAVEHMHRLAERITLLANTPTEELSATLAALADSSLIAKV